MTSSVLSHKITGSGAPLVLLNGGLMTIAAWDGYAAALSPQFQVVRCDFRGQLLSPGDPPPTVAGHAGDLVQLFDALGIGAAHVVGASFGALVGLTLAADAPSRVRTVVAITATDRMTPAMDAGSMKVREACQEALAGGDGGKIVDWINPATWSPEFLAANSAFLAARRQAVASLPAAYFQGLDALVASIVGLDLRPLLPRITAPTLIVGGERDLTFPVEHSRALSGAIPGARLEIVPKGPHGLVLEHAAEVIALVKSFVEAQS